MSKKDWPIGHTCNSINQVISELKSIQQRILTFYSFDNITKDNLSELEECISYFIDGKDSHFEFLRTSNEKLRDWGDELVVRVEDKEEELRVLENKFEDYKEETEKMKFDFEEEIKELKSKVFELESKIEEFES